jgi:[ribosomal protein S18]-alanine N-acetyltransferase
VPVFRGNSGITFKGKIQDMALRPATEADVPAIFELLRRAPSTSQWSEAQIAHTVLDHSSQRLSLVVVEDKIIQAFLAARGVAGEWELENIVVADAAKRRGYGTQLIASLLEHARGQRAASIFLEVRSSNVAARRLYENFRFEVASRRPQYYRNPSEDAVLYRLHLHESAP